MRSTIAWLVLLAACAGDDAPDTAAPRESVTEEKLLLVGEIAEATLTGGAGDRAVIQLAAPKAALDWNLHGHAGGGSQTVNEELRVMTATYAFSPSTHADWSLLLRNQDTAPMMITVTIDLYGEMAWSGWQ